MLLLGGIATGPELQGNDLFVRVFRDLPSLVRESTPVSRFVGFETADDDPVRFFGMEARTVPAEYPDGLRLLKLTTSELRLWSGSPDPKRTPIVEPLEWRWHTDAPTECGDFVVDLHAPGYGIAERRERMFAMSANAYYDTTVDRLPDDVEVVAYDDSWPRRYAEMELWLVATLGRDVARRVEHYGSTAIPGMPAKPVVDLLVEIPSFEAARPVAIPALSGPCWEYWGFHDHMTFVRREKPMGRRLAHVHLAPAGHRVWEGVALRDYFRRDHAARERYLSLKRDLASRYRTDREAYTAAKSELVRILTDEALGRREA